MENVATDDWVKNSYVTTGRSSGFVLWKFISLCLIWAVQGVYFSRTIIHKNVTKHHARFKVAERSEKIIIINDVS